jgi:hypothetical protein
MAPLINAGDEQCTCWLFPELTGRVFPVQNQVDTDRTEGGPRCHEPPPAEDRPETHAGARTWPAASTSNRRPTGVDPVAAAATGGPSCGCACPAAGSRVRTTHRTSTPKPTTRRPTTRSPAGCRTAHARGGVTSIGARSEPGRRGAHVPDSPSRRRDVSISASAAARPTHAVPSTLLPGSSSL